MRRDSRCSRMEVQHDTGTQAGKQHPVLACYAADVGAHSCASAPCCWLLVQLMFNLERQLNQRIHGW